jgi:putative flippase GtrA
VQELRRFARFLGVGVVNTIFGYTVFALLYMSTGLHRLAIVIATILGILFNYFTIGRAVFDYRGKGVLGRFVLGYAVVCFINIVAVDALARFGWDPLWGQAFMLPIAAVLAYAINALLVFRTA